MVAYGDTLRRSRRPGWEDAYVDYDALRSLLEGIEQRQQQDDHDTGSLQAAFLTLLRKEIEKVSLFCLSRQGEIAEAVGALRFDDVELSMVPRTLAMLPSNRNVQTQGDEDDTIVEDLGEDAALLPTGSIVVGPLKTPKITRKAAAATAGSPSRALFKARESLRSSYKATSDKADSYAEQGVELLHILRFICVNAMAFRKILKKHDKIMLKSKNRPLQKSSSSSRHVVLVDGPEDHLQQLANSASVAAIHSSLLAALLDEEEKDRLHHQELAATTATVYNNGITSNSTITASRIRLECTVSSIQVLREYAQRMDETFQGFLSQKAMIATGHNSGGLSNATQQALQLVIRFQPDSLLVMNDKALFEWHSRVFGKKAGVDASTSFVTADLKEHLEEKGSWGGVNSASMIINLLSTLLYTVNYYIIAPTANHYALLLGVDGAFGATLVGASSFSAIFAAFVYSLWYTKSSFRSALVFSALCPCLGNILYALAISYKSMSVAICGRSLVGFGSAEVVNRQLISACVSFRCMTRASALFVAAGAIGMSVGPLLAALLDMTQGRDIDVDLELPFMPAGGIIFNHTTSPGFLMAVLWFLEMLALVVLFREPERVNAADQSENRTSTLTSSGILKQGSVHFTDYGSTAMGSSPKPVSSSSNGAGLCTELTKVKALIFDSMALPVTLLLFGYIELVDEVLISSCSMVCRRYFSWHGSRAGLLIAALGSLVLPAHYVVEGASHRFEERAIMQYSIIFICASLFAILNYEGLIFDMIGVAVEAVEPDDLTNSTADGMQNLDISVRGENITSFLNKELEVPYDWGAGIYVYIIFLSAIFMGTILLEGVDTSLMAQKTPSALNETFVNSGLLATLMGLLGRVAGDSIITLSAFLDNDIFTDFVNATFFPMIPLALIGYLLVWRNYDSLFASGE